jgi:hypothetical protein
MPIPSEENFLGQIYDIYGKLEAFHRSI